MEAPTEIGPQSDTDRDEAALEARWYARFVGRLADEPSDADPPVVRAWRERDRRLADLEAAFAAEQQQHQALRQLVLDRELRRTLETLPLQANVDVLLPVLRPVIEARFDLSLDAAGCLVLADRHRPDHPTDPIASLTQLLEPLNLLRRSQAALDHPNPEPSGSLPPALALARAHLEAMRRA